MNHLPTILFAYLIGAFVFTVFVILETDLHKDITDIWKSDRRDKIALVNFLLFIFTLWFLAIAIAIIVRSYKTAQSKLDVRRQQKQWKHQKQKKRILADNPFAFCSESEMKHKVQQLLKKQ